MRDLNNYISIYKKHLKKGDIQIAYKELVKYVVRLKTEYAKSLSHRFSFGNTFQGYMDYTYFYFSNDYLKSKNLKFGLFLLHKEMRFEVWLLGRNKKYQNIYWDLFKTSNWNKYKKRNHNTRF